jgi:hypothetical protein
MPLLVINSRKEILVLHKSPKICQHSKLELGHLSQKARPPLLSPLLLSQLNNLFRKCKHKMPTTQTKWLILMLSTNSKCMVKPLKPNLAVWIRWALWEWVTMPMEWEEECMTLHTINNKFNNNNRL